MKAIITRWECPSCGNAFTTKEVFGKTNTGKYSFNEPKDGCTCGRKHNFKLLSFESATAQIVADKEE